MIHALLLLEQIIDTGLLSVLFDFGLLEGLRARSKHLRRDRIGQTVRSMMKIALFLYRGCKDICSTFSFDHFFSMLQVVSFISFLISIIVTVLFTKITALFKWCEPLNSGTLSILNWFALI